MHLARLAAFQNDRQRGSALGDDKMTVKRGDRQQRRNGKMVLVHAPVGEDEDVRPLVVRLIRLDEQAGDRLGKAGILII